MCSDEENEATFFCVECQEYLCEMCTNAHKTVRLTENHQVISLEEMKDGNQMNVISKSISNSQIYCQIHQEEEIKLFCEDCKLSICSLCVPQHPSHKILVISEAIVNENQSLIGLINQVSFHFVFFFSFFFFTSCLFQ